MAEGLFRLYLVTDRTRTAGRQLLDVVEPALQGGVDAVQLREKDLPAQQLCEIASRLRALCRRYDARFLVNDRIDIALAVGADGVHLPANSFRIADARRLVGRGLLIGVSAHRLEDARVAAAGGADFMVLGPIFDTPSKRAFGAPLGVSMLARVSSVIDVPLYAIGGVTADRVDNLRQNAHGIAVVSAILEADDPRAAAAALRAALR